MSLSDYKLRAHDAMAADRGRAWALDGSDNEVRLRILRGGQAAQRSQFLHLAELWKGLEHPHVVPVLEVGEEGGNTYLVEDLPAGLELAAIVALETPGLLARIDLLEQIAAALHFAHGWQVLHRGLEPSEVRVTAGGEAIVAGFGVGRLLTTAATESDMEAVAATVLARLPPEQVLGAEADVAGDVYAFGVLAHELLAGEFPFSTKSAATLLADKMRDQAPSMEVARLGCPRSVGRLVADCMARDPGERPSDFDQIGCRLREAQEAIGEAGEIRSPKTGPVAEVGGRDAAPDGTVSRLEAERSRVPHRASWRRWQRLGRGRSRWGLAIVSVLAIAVILVLFRAPSQRPAGVESSPPVTAVAPAYTPAIGGEESGVLRIDARPWAEILSITEAGGRQLSLPPVRYTPLSLRLPTGQYHVELGRPDRSQSVICSATVVDGGIADCVAEFLAVSPQQYFRESGWWR